MAGGAAPIVVLTCAEVPVGDRLYETRAAEYRYAIARVASYGWPMRAVTSETSCLRLEAESALEKWRGRLEHLTRIPSTVSLGAQTKSQQELVSLRELVRDMPTVDPDRWIFKLSGRYLLTNDALATAIRAAGPEVGFVGRFTDGATQASTFAFGMRAGLFKEFYEGLTSAELGHKNIERALKEWLDRRGVQCTAVPNLGVYVSVAHTGIYDVY
jgi:hypothetical protein